MKPIPFKITEFSRSSKSNICFKMKSYLVKDLNGAELN